MEAMVNDAFGNYREQETNIDESRPLEEQEEESKDSSDFHEFINDGNQTLYEGNDEKELNACKHCGTSRWNPEKKKKQPLKVLRYFPLKPRLQRLFMSRKTANHMRWHASEINKDGLIWHPRDGEAWKEFDLRHPEFASDPRNVRLGLATDGFNPFGAMSLSYSIWPVFLTPYNFPPWMCMKHTTFILSMIIPRKEAPGNKIDVYLEPLIKELSELWSDGVDTFDASINETFRMRATLMWTISDFPGLGNLSGWNTYTGLACPTCNFDTEPCRLYHGSKWCFMGHRRFLSRNHKFRFNRVRFDGSVEERNPPSKKSGSDILRCVNEAQQKIFGLKSHDCHIIMEELLPFSRRKLLPNNVTAVLVELCSFFKVLSNKSLDMSELQILQDRIVITLCHMEMKFPPSFFTIMVHLTVHLIEEAKLGGPSFGRNKARPEGSIAEGYLAEESLTFCSRYLDDIETRFNRPRRVCDDPKENESSSASSIFPHLGKPVGASSTFTLTPMEKLQAHRYVLLNCEVVAPFIE
ncbi:uncharacterized protein LOC131657454 [Vicia villosa]|uniref:uncharacterized protein LOC131657454 n=1 Tax=Vicia villosa TaxID=3911 RepID=UPI00273BD233|nr:uncharacterized protein LOC131657454 [Vicia villosa]